MNVTSKAVWYIESHITGDLSLQPIASAVGVSHFHLSRAFATATGQSLSGYVRTRRLSEAAKRLASGAPDILAVALESGYGSHEAFTRAFRQNFGLTPEQLRSQAQLHTLQLQEPLRMNGTTLTPLASPRLITHGALLIFGIGERYTCSNVNMPAQWERFVPYLGSIPGQVGPVAYGVISHADEAGSYDYVCGVEVAAFPSQPPEFTRLRIPPQTYAVFEHRDHISSIGATWNAIWNGGLPNSGFEAADGPAFERYDENFDGRTGLGGLQIWVPVRV